MNENAISTEDKPPALDELRERKGVLSRSIGQAKKAGQAIDALLDEMKSVTAQLKALEATQATNKKTKQTKADIQKPELPTRFQADTSVPVSASMQPSNTLNIISVQSDEDINKWNRFVNNNPRSCAYHQYCLRNVIEQTFGHQTHYLLAKDGAGTAVGILPLVQLNSRLFGNYVVSMPFFNYGGALAESASAEQQLFKAAKQWADQIGAKHTELRHVQQKEFSAVKQDKITMLLPLPDSEDTLWQDIGSKVRAQIKKTEEYQPSYRVGQLELLDDFYQVFSTNMRDLGTPVYSKKWFTNLLRALPDSSWIVIAYIDNKPAAAAFLIGWKDTLEIPWASSMRKFNYTNVNMFLYWQVLREAIKRGYSFFDFGRSSKDANTYRFKKQWGARPQQLYWHYQLADGESLPELNPHNPKYKLMITAWQKLPLVIANMIGPHVVKNLP